MKDGHLGVDRRGKFYAAGGLVVALLLGIVVMALAEEQGAEAVTIALIRTVKLSPIGAFILVLAAAGLGAYLGSYLREMGKNRAMQEALDSLVRKTEEIKATISNDLWVRQNVWKLKCDTYLGLLKALDNVAFTMRQLDFLESQRVPREESLYATYGEELSRYMATLREWTAMAAVILPDRPRSALDDLDVGWQEVDRAGLASRSYSRLLPLLAEANASLLDCARADLAVDSPPSSQT